MKKRFMFMVIFVLFTVVLVSCKDDEPVESTPTETEPVVLSEITFSGVDDVTIAYGTAFNVFDGVTALGNDGVDYTSSITVASLTVNDGVLDTTKVQEHGVRYEVRVGEFLQQHWRYITVTAPERPDDQFVVNGTFDTDTSFWDDSANGLYVADGAALTITHEEGALKAEVVAGSNLWTPRLGQQGIPFEIDTTYEVSFKAKSSVAKNINVQVGELISNDPWFIDFKPNQTEHFALTTEWVTYSFKFTMHLDNPRGGILFEMGTLNGEAIDATIWLDDIVVTESTPDVDTDAPVFSGIINDISLTVNSNFDPMAGITAYDMTDGDVTSEIVVTYEDSLGNPLASIDTSVLGDYKVIYTVEDSLGNSDSVEVTLHVVSLIFKDTNLVVNPSFETEISTETPEWAVWSQDWGTAPVVVTTQNVENGTLAVDITGGGDASWAVQLHQTGFITLEEGVTYRLQFTASATAARSLSVALGYGNPWVEYGRKNGIEITTEAATYEYVFTVQKETHLANLVFELGSQTGFADGVVTFSNVALNELDVEPLVTNSDFQATGWRFFYNNWEGSTGSAAVVNGEFVMTLTSYALGGANWKLQLIQDEVALGISSSDVGVLEFEPSTTYTLSFDAYSSVPVTIVPLIANTTDWANFVANPETTLTSTKTTYTYTLTTPETLLGTEVFKFEFGNGVTPFTDADPAVVITFDNLQILDGDTNPIASVYNGSFDQVLVHKYDNAGSGVGTMTATADGAQIVVETLGAEAYTPHFYTMLDELAPGNYTVVFRMTASVARDLRFNMVLPNAGWGSILDGGFVNFSVEADTLYTFTLDFVVAANTTDVKVEIDFGTLGGELVSLPGTFVIHELLVYPRY